VDGVALPLRTTVVMAAVILISCGAVLPIVEVSSTATRKAGTTYPGEHASKRFPADRCQLDCVTATVRPHDWSAERRVDGRHHRESWLLVLKISSKCSFLVTPSYPNP
jgi:hypothetical protein